MGRAANSQHFIARSVVFLKSQFLESCDLVFKKFSQTRCETWDHHQDSENIKTRKWAFKKYWGLRECHSFKELDLILNMGHYAEKVNFSSQVTSAGRGQWWSKGMKRHP